MHHQAEAGNDTECEDAVALQVWRHATTSVESAAFADSLGRVASTRALQEGCFMCQANIIQARPNDCKG